MSKPHAMPPDWPGIENDPPGGLEADILARLADADGPADIAGDWPESLWQLVLQAGANRWTLPAEFGGQGCDRPTIVRRYARLSEGSLTAAFILTQHDASVRRLAAAAGRGVTTARSWLERIGQGAVFTTVGISHLTTSRRRGTRAMAATETPDGGYRLDGVMPWVTAAPRADVFVTGATLEDGRQMLIALPMDRSGVAVSSPFDLAALQASCTSEVTCEETPITPDDILAGPAEDVMGTASGATTGGLETSSLALGQAARPWWPSRKKPPAATIRPSRSRRFPRSGGRSRPNSSPPPKGVTTRLPRRESGPRRTAWFCGRRRRF